MSSCLNNGIKKAMSNPMGVLLNSRQSGLAISF